ncbi:Serine protease htra2, mitochondrial, partial [Nowakowskiella sp. JEL0407]
VTKLSDGGNNSENVGNLEKSQAATIKKSFGAGFISDAVELVMDSVVNITVESDVSNLFSKKTFVSSGSGFVISKDGMFLTNAHVVSEFEPGSELVITDSNGVQYNGALYSIDLLSDLAVVQVVEGSRNEPKKVWKPVKFGRNTNLRPGDWVISIGCPFGLQGTVTAGIISSRRRKNTEIGGKDSRVEYIQTDCVVHTGSSGGPLINLDGEVIGINTTRAEGEGISFAIRADNALGIIDQLLNKGHVVRPWIGVKMVSLTDKVKQQLKANSEGEENDLLSYERLPVVVTRSPAYLSGLEVGDVIIAVNGIGVNSSREILQQIGFKVGEPVMLKIKRAVPLDMDWDGRVRRYETITTDIRLTPEELDVEMYGDRAEFHS